MRLSRQNVRFILLWVGIWSVALTVAFLIPLNVHAQSDNCNAIVTTDAAGVLSNPAAVIQASSKLIDEGVDVHVITLGPLHAGETLTQAAQLQAIACGWRNDTKFKPNLLLLAVAPKDRKKNAFFGQAIAPALENAGEVDYIYSQAANPYFKSGDFAGGLAAAERDFGAKIATYHDQQKHPIQKQTVVNNEATDFSGLWTFFKWLLIIGVIVAAIAFTYALYRKRKDEETELKAAQGDAIDARNRATDVYDALSDSDQTVFAKQFTNLSNTVANDPTVPNLTVAEYRRIERAWDGFYDAATGNKEYPPAAQHDAGPLPQHFDSVPVDSYSVRPVHTHSTTIINNNSSNDDMLTGVLVGEALSRDRDREVEPRYSSPAPSYSTPSPSYSSGDESTWSSSDDSPSSSFDSGDSSSFDSGSSDSGSSFSSGDDSSF